MRPKEYFVGCVWGWGRRCRFVSPLLQFVISEVGNVLFTVAKILVPFG